MGDFRAAACQLLGVCVSVRRNGNTDEFMERLCEAMNGICELVGERDAIAYLEAQGRFVVVSGFQLLPARKGVTRGKS